MSRATPGSKLGGATEPVLIALAATGDREAFTELVRRRQNWLRVLLRRLCRDSALSDDLAQLVLLQCWRSLPTLHNPLAFGGWLRRLAINAWLQQRRTPTPEAWDHDRLIELADSAPAPGEALPATLDLQAALARLPDDVRLCVVLAYSEGMSHGEISAATALPLGTVKSHIRRGAERLRAWLPDYAGQGPSP